MAGELRFPRINTVILSGRLTREVELRYTTSGLAVSKLSLAFDKRYQRNGEWIQETSYIDIVAWDKLAIRCAEELDKGSAILVEGSLKTNSYQDKNNQNRKSTQITAFKINFLEKNPKEGFNESHPANTDQVVPESNITDDDVPF